MSQIWGAYQIPRAFFSTNSREVLLGEEVVLNNNSRNYSGIDWQIPGAKILAESDREITITFLEPGLYNVSLIAEDSLLINTGKTVLEKMLVRDLNSWDEYIHVKKDTSKWGGFVPPEVNFSDSSSGSSGSEAYHRIVPDPQKLISETAEDVCRILYYSDKGIYRRMRVLNYVVRADMESGIPSYLNGEGYIRGIDFSSDHVETVYKRTSDDNIVEAEILGVLFHEMTHGYQLQPLKCGVYDGESEYWAFIEGMADAVRIRSGYHQNSRPTVDSKKWLAGYTQTGYFYNWLANSYDNDFLRKLNRTTLETIPWSFEKAVKLILNRDADELWREYKKSFNTKSKLTVDFQASSYSIHVGSIIEYRNLTVDGETFDWTFEGGTPRKSSEKSPIIKYKEPGLYRVSLVAHNKSPLGPGIEVKREFIEVK